MEEKERVRYRACECVYESGKKKVEGKEKVKRERGREKKEHV